MLFWNRIEIYCGTSLEEFNNFRDILASGGIRYDSRLAYRNYLIGSNRARFGALGFSPKPEAKYYLYVHKNDIDKAMFYLRINKS